MAVLIIADHDGKALRDTTHRCVSAGLCLSDQADLLVYGVDTNQLGLAAAKIAGVRSVITANSPALGHDIAEAVADLVLSIASDYEAILFVASTSGKSIAPRIAALLDCALISDVLEINDKTSFVRPIYAGNALETVSSKDKQIVLTVRTTAFSPALETGSAAIKAIEPVTKTKAARFISEQKVESARPELGAAKIIVSGGRALGSADEFKAVIEPLADRLGAAVGASRAAVDAGYAPNDYQVGQTGKVVAPGLYIAIGISGAIQHLAGMKDSKIIVAINKDPEAPIFSVADFGLVDDYKTAIPALMTALA